MAKVNRPIEAIRWSRKWQTGNPEERENMLRMSIEGMASRLHSAAEMGTRDALDVAARDVLMDMEDWLALLGSPWACDET